MSKNKTIISYLPDFLDYLEIEKGLSSKTQENYSRFLHKFFTWLAENSLSNLRPDQLSPALVSKYRIFLARRIDPRTKKTLKKSTQNYYLIALRSLLDFFVEKDIQSLSPTKIKLAKEKGDKEVKFLKLEQLKRLLDAPNESKIGLRDKAILETLFSTGLRVAELVALDCEQLRIREHTEDLEIAVVGKGSKVRTVYFSQRAVNALRNYLESRKNVLDKALFINYKPGIEKTSESRRLTTKSIEDIVKKYVKIAGLPIMATPHTLRHSFATDLLKNGVDLRLVQEFLGHQNISTTQIYTHVTNKQLKDVHKKFHGLNN